LEPHHTLPVTFTHSLVYLFLSYQLTITGHLFLWPFWFHSLDPTLFFFLSFLASHLFFSLFNLTQVITFFGQKHAIFFLFVTQKVKPVKRID
jgi:hypothetical protein